MRIVICDKNKNRGVSNATPLQENIEVLVISEGRYFDRKGNETLDRPLVPVDVLLCHLEKEDQANVSKVDHKVVLYYGGTEGEDGRTPLDGVKVHRKIDSSNPLSIVEWQEIFDWIEIGCDRDNLPQTFRPSGHLSHKQILRLMSEAFWLMNAETKELVEKGISLDCIEHVRLAGQRSWFSEYENWKEVLGSDLQQILQKENRTVSEAVKRFAIEFDKGNLAISREIALEIMRELGPKANG